MLFATTLISTLASIVIGQQTSECGAVFESCKQTQETYKLETCGPLQARNITQFEECSCIQAANLDICYDQCLNFPDVMRERPSITNAATTLCAKVNINPKALPKGSWITVTGPSSASPSASPRPSTTTSGNGTATSPKPSAKSSADSNAVMSLTALIGLIFAF